jgi:hypothetical protein
MYLYFLFRQKFDLLIFRKLPPPVPTFRRGWKGGGGEKGGFPFHLDRRSCFAQQLASCRLLAGAYRILIRRESVWREAGPDTKWGQPWDLAGSSQQLLPGKPFNTCLHVVTFFRGGGRGRRKCACEYVGLEHRRGLNTWSGTVNKERERHTQCTFP